MLSVPSDKVADLLMVKSNGQLIEVARLIDLQQSYFLFAFLHLKIGFFLIGGSMLVSTPPPNAR